MAPTTLVGHEDGYQLRTDVTPKIDTGSRTKISRHDLLRLPGAMLRNPSVGTHPGWPCARQRSRYPQGIRERPGKTKGLLSWKSLGTCNSGWKVTPVEANKWMVDNMFPKYPLGDIKDI